MSSQPHRDILFAVGSLPFWTGKRKLVRFLAGDPGSFWKGESPLKPIYLNHYAFGALSEQTPSQIRQHLQTLLSHNYLQRTDLAPDKPYKVMKFTDAGCKKYYNLLVLERGVSEPLWWLHHLAQLRAPPRSPIHTGGEVFEFSGDLYLSQSPPSVEPSERVKDEKTLQLRIGDRDLKTGRSYRFENLRVHCQRGVQLALTDRSAASTLAASDVRRQLTHFSEGDSSRAPNPFVLRGTLRSVDQLENDRICLTLENNEGDRVRVRTPATRVPDDVTLDADHRYVLGPVRETNDESDGAGLQLEDSGSIEPYRP